MILFLIGFALAKEPKIIYKQKTEIDFEGLEIEGELLKPHGSVIRERKPAPFNPLIELRTDFQKEILQSAEDIK